MLLILDNCEHVVDAAAVLTDTILRTCPKVRVLATSQEPLRIQGEAVHPVQPLTVPDPLWIAGLATWASGDAEQAIELEKQSLDLKLPMREGSASGSRCR